MMNRLSPRKRLPIREMTNRLDRVAAELNMVLMVIALGLATLDFTFFVSEKVIDNLPPITHVSYDAPDTATK
jgi:hypothetical protein